MRKWMRERLQRRKRKPTEPSDQPAPPPLQPAYFEAGPESHPAVETEESRPEPAASGRRSEPAYSPPADAEPLEDEPQAAESSSAGQSQEQSSASPAFGRKPKNSGQANRGRRRRGGRGRGGRGREQAVAQAFAPAAVKGSIPAVPTESGEEEAAGSAQSGDQPSAPAQPASATLPAVAAQARPPKGTVVLAIGLPGSGKSSWFKRHSIVPLSSDMMRTILFDDVREQRFQDLVFSNLRSMLKARLIARRPMNYVDATNLTPQERQHWIKLAKDYGYEVQAVFFDVPLEVCIERHQRRDRVVPDDVMRRMAGKLKPPAFEEGFAKITVVRVKKKDAAAAPQDRSQENAEPQDQDEDGEQ